MFCFIGKYMNYIFYLNFLFLRESICMGENLKFFNMNDIEK